MDDLFTVPKVIEPLTAWGYVGWTVLAVIALVALMVAAAVFSNSSTGGLVIAGLAVSALFPAVLAYFRTVPSGWHLPNLGVWAGFLLAGIAASVLAYRYLDTYSYADAGVLLPVGGVVVTLIPASLLDLANERLAGIPMSWGVLGVLLIVAVLFVMSAMARPR